MEPVDIPIADLHAALFLSHIQPMYATYWDGSVLAWNDAAERCTGLSREWAVGRKLWEVQAAIAPAVIPYEQACEAARSSFQGLVQGCDRHLHPSWRHQTDETILAADGRLHHVYTEIFPVWIGPHLILVNTLSDTQGPYARREASAAATAS